MFLNHKCKQIVRYVLVFAVIKMFAFVPAAHNENRKHFPAASQHARDAYGKLPMSFEENRGQFGRQFDFSARGPGYSVLLNAGGVLLKLQNDASQRATDTLSLKLLGTASNAQVRGLDVLQGEANYFVGSKERWITHIRRYRKIEAAEIYPGVNLIYYGDSRGLEYDFVLQPDVNPDTIHFAFDGASRIQFDVNGSIVFTLGGSEIRQPRPTVFQDIDGRRLPVEAGYAMRSDNTIGFSIGAYDHSKSLVIDPQLIYSTYLGDLNSSHAIAIDPAGNAYICGETLDPWSDSSRNAFIAKLNPAGTAELYYDSFGGDQADIALAVAADASGNAYVTGYTAVGVRGHPAFRQFPVVNPIQTERDDAGYDAFITKFDPSGKIVYSTTLGGSNDDQGTGVAVDAAGNIYVTGETLSKDFPISHPLQSSLRGNADAFVTVLNPQGSAFLFSTYIGGSDDDHASGIAVGANGNVYVTGQTQSADFPTLKAAQPVFGGGSCRSLESLRPCKDAFVLRIDWINSVLQYSTYLGGSGDDQANGIAVDLSGNAYVAGSTSSSNFPAVAAFQPTLIGATDAFIAKIGADGSGFLYSTYLGGSGAEQGNGVAIDGSGNAYVTGNTTSADFPQARPLQLFVGKSDAFVSKISNTGSALLYSTLLGGSSGASGTPAANSALGIAVDSNGNAYIAGLTGATDFPVTGNSAGTRFSLGPPNWLAFPDGAETFVTKLTDENHTNPTGPIPADAQWTRFEESSPNIQYSGNWYTNESDVHSGGTAALAIDPGARAVFTFNGTAVRWIGYRYSWTGIAKVYVDGLFQQLVDTYGSTAQAQAVMYTTPVLPAGVHTLTIEVSGTHSILAQSNWVWVDAFDAILSKSQ